MEEKKNWGDLTPQQSEFLKNYLDPNSETWGNAYRSALKSNYSEEYSDNIMSLMPKWLSEALQDTKLVNQALINLSVFIGDSENKSLQWDATKFTLTRLSKNKFSERQELTGENGKPLILPSELINKNDIDTSTETNSPRQD